MKKQSKPIVTYIKTSLLLYGYALIFSIAAMVFLIDKIPAWVQAIMGILFLAPIVITYFLTGRREGETLYKQSTAGTLTAIHDKAPVKVPLYKMIYHVIGFAAPLILLAVIAGAAHVTVLRGIVAFILMPITVMFLGFGALDLGVATVSVIYIYVPFVILLCLVFCAGFYYSAMKLKRQQGEIESELRSFDN